MENRFGEKLQVGGIATVFILLVKKSFTKINPFFRWTQLEIMSTWKFTIKFMKYVELFKSVKKSHQLGDPKTIN